MKSIVNWIIAGAVIVVVGLVFVIIGASFGGSCYGYRENWTETEQSFSEQISAVKCDLETCSLKISYYDGESVYVSYPESSIRESAVSVNLGVLTITSEMTTSTYNYSSDFPIAVIKIPESYTVSLDLEIDLGCIYIYDGAYNNLNLNVDAGVIEIGSVTFNSAAIEVDAGNVTITDMTCGTLVCNIDTGAVKFNKLACPNIQIGVDLGSVKACLAGSRDDYTATCSIDLGSCNISSGGSGVNILKISVDAGSAEITFDG